MLVLSVQPAEAGEADLRRALGLSLPQTSLADSGKLQETINGHGFLSNFGGHVDIVELVDAFMAPDSSENAALFALMEYDPGHRCCESALPPRVDLIHSWRM